MVGGVQSNTLHLILKSQPELMQNISNGSGTIEFPEFLELMKQKYGNMTDTEGDIK